MAALGALYYGLVGAAVGSFLNLCIDRLPYGLSIISPASHCASCNRRLAPRDLVPIASYLALKGRCGYCGAGVAIRVLVVEVLMAGVYGWLWLWQGPGLRLATVSVYVSLLMLITFIDLEHRLILNRVIYPAILGAFPAAVLYGKDPVESLAGGIVGLAVMSVIFLLANWYHAGGMGFGDVKLVTFVGIFAGMPQILVTLYVTSIIGGIAAGLLLLMKLKGRQDYVPYGPFICLGAFVTLFAGEPMSNWYLRITGGPGGY